jgi:hypothetical protein
LGRGHHRTNGSSCASGVARHSPNMPGICPVDIDKAAFSGRRRHRVSQPTRNSLTSVCSSYIKRVSPTGTRWGCDRRHYTESRTHPSAWRLISAYFLDHDARSYERISRVFEGESEGLTRDDILDNIMITWLTNTALSGARLYWENKLGYSTPKASASRLP